MRPQCVGRMAERATQLSTAVAEAANPMAVSRQDLTVRRADLLAQLVDAAVDVGPLLGATRWQRQLDAVCEAALLAFGAAAVSVARAHDDHLRYVAASGAGAESIVGTELGLADGLAGFVAASGQSMVIDQPANDPRFARDVAERTGYLPDSMLLVPVDDATGTVAGVLTVLDRTVSSADALALGSAFATLAAEPLLAAADADQTARALTAAFVDAYAAGEPRLSTAIRRAVRPVAAGDVDLAALAATLNDLRQLDPTTCRRLIIVIDELVALATPRRRPR